MVSLQIYVLAGVIHALRRLKQKENSMGLQQPFDLSAFRQHIEIYEMMIEAAKNRTISEIAPRLKRIESRQEEERPIATGVSAYSNPVIIRKSGGDLWVFLILGVWIGAAAFMAYKKGYFISEKG